MSFAGLKQFDKNLRAVMDSDAFKKADEAEKLRISGRLVRSEYGAGSLFGLGAVKELKIKKAI